MLTRAEARQQNMDHEAAPSTGLSGRGFRPRESMANAAIRSAHSSQLEGRKGRLVVLRAKKGPFSGSVVHRPSIAGADSCLATRPSLRARALDVGPGAAGSREASFFI